MPTTLMCEPKLLQKDLSGRVYIVTGANSGAGLATATQLAKQGATVVGACRRVDAGKEAFAETGNVPGSVGVMKLDLASFSSVKSFVKAFLAKHDRLDGLVNNAGIVCPQSTTKDGFGIQFAVNYLGHFLLTELLLDTLQTSAPSRIVCVSSVVHVGRRQPVELDFDDLDFQKRPYSMWGAYSEAKLAVVLQAVDLARRLEGSGVTTVSLHPGWVRSNLGRHMLPETLGTIFNAVLRPFSGVLGIINLFEGAQTTLHCLLDEDVPNHNGGYFSQTGSYPNREDRAGGWPMPSPNPHAHDKALAGKLYNHSLDLVGLTVNR